MKKFTLIIIALLTLSSCSFAEKEPLGRNYYKQDEKVYFQQDGIDVYLPDADPSSFETLEYQFAKDHDNAFYKSVPFEVDDLQSFEALNNWFARDKNQIYGVSTDSVDDSDNYEVLKKPEIDLESFEILNSDYAKDKNHVYKSGKIDDKFNPQSFKAMEKKLNSCKYQFYADSEAVYYFDEKVEEADPATFDTVGGSYLAMDEINFYTVEENSDSALGPCKEDLIIIPRD